MAATVLAAAAAVVRRRPVLAPPWWLEALVTRNSAFKIGTGILAHLEDCTG